MLTTQVLFLQGLRAGPTREVLHNGGGLGSVAVDSWTTSSLLLRQLGDFDDNSAWNLLAEHFRDPIVSIAQRRGLDAAQAEDAAQETLLAFARAYREGNYQRTKGRLKDWLFGIAYRQINAVVRRSRRADMTSSAIEPAREPAIESELGELWDSAWRRAVLARCLDQARAEVHEKTFRAFQLVALHERSAARVADELGMTRAQVYDAKYRVSCRIQELAREYEDA